MSALADLLRRLLTPLLLPLGGVALAALTIALLLAKVDARHWHKLADNSEALRVIDRKDWADATFKATYDALMNVYRVEADRRKIDERTIHALDADRRTADAGYQRLLAQSAAHRSAPGRADLSEEREATCRAVANTSCDQIPALLKAAQDNTDQLLRWIEWGKAQGEVAAVPNEPSKPELDQ